MNFSDGCERYNYFLSVSKSRLTSSSHILKITKRDSVFKTFFLFHENKFSRSGESCLAKRKICRSWKIIPDEDESF